MMSDHLSSSWSYWILPVCSQLGHACMQVQMCTQILAHQILHLTKTSQKRSPDETYVAYILPSVSFTLNQR